MSDLDLVALVDGRVDARRRSVIVALHRDLDRSAAAGDDLGCVYVDAARLTDLSARHPTWTHGNLVDRPLSGIARAELARFGIAVFGRQPQAVYPAATDEDVKHAAKAELLGYWATAARHPWWFLDRDLAELSLTAMARGRHAMVTGQLLTKTASIDLTRAPAWLQGDLRARRRGLPARSRRLRTAWIAWRDARQTTRSARDSALQRGLSGPQ